MSLVVVGLNHRTAPLTLLERMAVSEAALAKALADLVGRAHISEAVLLSTCNRTEVYVSAEKFHPGLADVREFLTTQAFLPPEDFVDHLYIHHDTDCARHLFEVAAGLDSAVLGETEVLGQVRRAWETAHTEGVTGPALNLLFRHAVEAGKLARTRTGISQHTTSLSHAAVELASARHDGLAGRHVVVVGAGEMGEGLVRSVAEAGSTHISVVNRTWDKAVALADSCGGEPVRLSDLGDLLSVADVVLTSTGAPTLLLDRDELDAATRDREGPMVVVDLAVPRDIDPAAADLANVVLLDMDDLRSFVEVGREERRRQADSVRSLLDDELDRFAGVVSAREVAPLMEGLRVQAEETRQAELARFATRLEALEPSERDAVEALTKGLVAKLLHTPSVELKDAAGTARGERLAESVRDLFDL